jgi:hypothetical protein
MKFVTILFRGIFLVCARRRAPAIGRAHYILDKPAASAFPIVRSGTAAPIYVDSANGWR